MPSIPKYTKCAHLGCKNEKSKLGSYCLEHGGRDVLPVSEARARFNSKYQTAQWRSVRQRQLSMQPLCQACLCKGIVNSAQHVDHVWAWSQIGDKAFYHNLFQSLCAGCHSDKTYLEQQGIYRYYQNSGAIDYTIRDWQRVVGGSLS